MKNSNFTAILSAGLALATSAIAQQANMSVSLKGETVIVRVLKPTALSKVLEEFCRQTASSCEGTQNLSSSILVPNVTSGSWSEVLNRLMAGEKVNYVGSQPGRGQEGRLVVSERRTPVGLQPIAAIQVTSPSAPVAPVTVAPRDALREPSAFQQESVPEATVGSEASTVSAQSTSGVFLGSSLANMTTASGMAESSSPFSTGHGVAIPMTAGSDEGGSPFSIGHGLPITATPMVPDGSPFSAAGHPLPTTKPVTSSDSGSPFPMPGLNGSNSPR